MGKKFSKGRLDSLVAEENVENFEALSDHAYYINIHEANNANIVFNLYVKKKRKTLKLLKKMKTTLKRKDRPYHCSENTEDGIEENTRRNEHFNFQTSVENVLPCSESFMLAISSSSKDSPFAFSKEHNSSINSNNEQFQGLHTPEINSGQLENTTVMHSLKDIGEERDYDIIPESDAEFHSQNMQQANYTVIRPLNKDVWKKTQTVENGLTLSFLTSASDNNCYGCSICERKELRTDPEKNSMFIENKIVNSTEEKKMNNSYICSISERKELRTDLEKSKILIENKIDDSIHVEEMKMNISQCLTSGSEYPRSTSYERNSFSDETKSLDLSDNKQESIEENNINCQDKQNYEDSNVSDTVLKKEHIMEEVHNSLKSLEDKNQDRAQKTIQNYQEESPKQNETSYMIVKDYPSVKLSERNDCERVDCERVDCERVSDTSLDISDVSGLMKGEHESPYVDENLEIENRKAQYLSEHEKKWYLIVCDRNVTTVVMMKDIRKTVERQLDLHRKICLADLTEYNALHGVSFMSDSIIVQQLWRVIIPVCEKDLFLFTSNHMKSSAGAVHLTPLQVTDIHNSQGNILDLCFEKLCSHYMYDLSYLNLEVLLESPSNGLTRRILCNLNKEDFPESCIVFNCYRKMYVLCHVQRSHTQLAIKESNHFETEIPLASKFIRLGTLRFNSLTLPVCAFCYLPQLPIHEERVNIAGELSNAVVKLFSQIFNSQKIDENIQPYSASIGDTVFERKVGLFVTEGKRAEFQLTEEEKDEFYVAEKERAEFHANEEQRDEFHVTEEQRDDLHVTEKEKPEFHATEELRDEMHVTEGKKAEIQVTREERAEFQDEKDISHNGNDSGYSTRHKVSDADSAAVSVLHDISCPQQDYSSDGNEHYNLEPVMNETDFSICIASAVDSLTVQSGNKVTANESVTTPDTELAEDSQIQKERYVTKARSKLHRKEKQLTSCSTSMLSQNNNIYDSDSSIDQESILGNNMCQYCKQSLGTKNKKCKHHKPIQFPKAEQNSDDDSEHEGIFKGESKVSSEKKNPAFITQTQKDSGLGSSSHGSYMYFTRQQLNEFKKQVETVTRRELERLTAKEVAREIHVRQTNSTIFGLSSYFDRLNSGEPISEEERLRYEWLRLATFQHYTGDGNSIMLARHGFYHDPSAGPTSTRCYLCEARHSSWTYFDNVEAVHRRQSPNCPFHENRNQESTNVPITYDSTSQSARGPPAVNTTSPPSTIASNVTDDRGSITSSIREITGSLTQAQISSSRNAAVQQPQDNDENRQHSLLALPNSRPYRVLGRSGETAYSHLTTPPRRNNIATGAESNAGLDAVANSTATSTATSTTTTTFRPSSILGGPIGAGAFGAANPPPSSTVPTSSSVTSTTAIPRAVLSAKASLLTPSQPPIGSGGRTDPTITVVVNNPKHPDYRELDARINSFQGWPDYLDQTARQMSEAGFFFVGVADFTRCFCCGGGLRNWEPGDDPMLEHTRWFPRCEYVNKLKGERYVAAVQRRHQEHMAEQQRQQQELAQRRDANRNPPDPMNTEAAAVLREMGYQQERIRDAILAVRQQIGVPDVTTQQVLAWLLDQHEGRSPPTSGRTSPTRDLGVKVNIVVTPSTTQTSTPSTVINTTATVSTAISTVLAGSTSTTTVSSTSTATGGGNQQSGSSTSVTSSSGAGSKPASQTGSSVNEAREGSNVDKQSAAARGESDEEEFKSAEETPSPDVKSTGKKKSKKKTKTKGGSKSTGATGGPVDAKTLKEENEKLREMQTCKICMERPVNTTLLPCGHLVCCDICAGRLNRCPICRKRIQGTVKTFMS